VVLGTEDCEREKQELGCCPGSLLRKYFILAIKFFLNKKERERKKSASSRIQFKNLADF